MAMAMLAWMFAIPVLGGMTGLRCMTPIALLCWFAYSGNLDVEGTWAAWTAMPVSVIVFAVLAVGELIGDKLPRTPNRTDKLPLISRVVFGGLVGAIAAIGLHGEIVEGALLSSFSALLWTFLGFHIRHSLVKKHGVSDLVVALVEDGVAIGLSVIAMGIVTG
jgi:uncharacterized membrane protein